MKRTGKRRWSPLTVIFAALACARTLVTGQVRRMRDRAEVTNMMGNKKMLYVGSFLLAVPGRAEACSFTVDRLQSHLMPNVETRTNPRPGGTPVDRTFHQCAGLALWADISSLIHLQQIRAKPVVADSKQISLSGQTCLQSDNTRCRPDEVMFEIRRLDVMAAFKRQFILSSCRNPIAKPVSTLL